ncbi:hypothetical protein TB2_043072 [Malus domestica]
MKAWLATARAGWRMKRNVARRRQERPKRSVVPTAEATQKENPSVIQDGTLERLELSPQELRPGFPHLPSVWKPSWVDPEVRADVLQAVLPQQRQGDWLHQELSTLLYSYLACYKFVCPCPRLEFGWVLMLRCIFVAVPLNGETA